MHLEPPTEHTLQHIAVLGTGTLGRQAAIQAALHGHDVFLYHDDRYALDAALRQIGKDVEERIRANPGAVDRPALFNRLFPTTNPKMAARNADLILETLSEPPDVKAEVLSVWNAWAMDHTLFASAAQLPFPLDLARRSGRPDRLVSLRFHPPIRRHTIVHVMPHAETADRTLEAVLAFTRTLGLTPRLRSVAGRREDPRALSMAS